MNPEEVRAIPPRMITAAQRESFFEDGYLHLEGVIPKPWVQRMQAALRDIFESSRGITQSDQNYVLERGHQAKEPRLRRLNRAVNNHAVMWEFASSADSILPDLVVNLIGPDVKFRDSHINFKLARGGEEVMWHQDSSHVFTNQGPLACCFNFEDETLAQGPLAVVPGSHKLGRLNRYDSNGTWGLITVDEMAKVDFSTAKQLTGPAGSITILHHFVLHGSARNESDKNRALLVLGFDPGDAIPIHPIPSYNELTGTFVRGRPPGYVRLEAGRLRLPPDWSKPEFQQYASKGVIFNDKAQPNPAPMM